MSAMNRCGAIPVKRWHPGHPLALSDIMRAMAMMICVVMLDG